MANTELVEVLRRVREAKLQVGKGLGKKSLKPAGRELLETAHDKLEATEDQLILEDLRKSVTQLKNASASLSQVVKDMKKSEERIKRIAEFVDDAAQALKVLADVVTAVAKLA